MGEPMIWEESCARSADRVIKSVGFAGLADSHKSSFAGALESVGFAGLADSHKSSFAGALESVGFAGLADSYKSPFAAVGLTTSALLGLVGAHRPPPPDVFGNEIFTPAHLDPVVETTNTAENLRELEQLETALFGTFANNDSPRQAESKIDVWQIVEVCAVVLAISYGILIRKALPREFSALNDVLSSLRTLSRLPPC